MESSARRGAFRGRPAWPAVDHCLGKRSISLERPTRRPRREPGPRCLCTHKGRPIISLHGGKSQPTLGGRRLLCSPLQRAVSKIVL